MGSTGTDVARETSDLVLAGDDFSSLVDALIEGRSFWRNLRRALGLLLGGNMGELSFMVTTGLLGLAGTLTVRQILATNLITDALPAVAVAVQEPEDRRLEGLEREGRASLGRPLRDEILRRTFSTSGPALASYLVALRAVGPGAARTVGFGTIVSTQLALTVDASRRQGTLTASVATAVGISGGALLALLTVPGARGLFQLSPLSPLGWSLIGVSTAAAPLIGRVLESLGEEVGAGAPTVRRSPKPRGSLPPVGVRPALPS